VRRLPLEDYGRGVGSVDDSGGDPDVLQGGPGHTGLGHSGVWTLGVAAAGLVGLLAGYAIGHGHDHVPTRTGPAATVRTTTPHPPPSAISATGPPFTQTGATCSIQHGHRLQLGIQIENQTTSIIHVVRVRTHEPLLGLHPLVARLGACGQTPGTRVSLDPSAIPARAATWITVTAEVLVKCPGPDPVQFLVRYRSGAHFSVERFAGFDDLGQVPYTGCAHDQ
jgi:hypothetical protein